MIQIIKSTLAPIFLSNSPKWVFKSTSNLHYLQGITEAQLVPFFFFKQAILEMLMCISFVTGHRDRQKRAILLLGVRFLFSTICSFYTNSGKCFLKTTYPLCVSASQLKRRCAMLFKNASF